MSVQVADIHTLAERYDVDCVKLREALREAEKRKLVEPPQVFQDVEIWNVADTDPWFCRWLRDQHGVRQAELADALGLSASHLSRIESGLHPFPEWRVGELRDLIEEIIERRNPAATGAA